jgi:hypothetical protein
MYLGTIYIHPKFRPDWTSNMAARRLAAILENKLSDINDLMAGLSQNFNLVTIHDIRQGFPICDLLFKVTEVKVQNVNISRHVSLLDLDCNLV